MYPGSGGGPTWPRTVSCPLAHQSVWCPPDCAPSQLQAIQLTDMRPGRYGSWQTAQPSAGSSNRRPTVAVSNTRSDGSTGTTRVSPILAGLTVGRVPYLSTGAAVLAVAGAAPASREAIPANRYTAPATGAGKVVNHRAACRWRDWRPCPSWF